MHDYLMSPGVNELSEVLSFTDNVMKIFIFVIFWVSLSPAFLHLHLFPVHLIRIQIPGSYRAFR